MKYCNQCGNQLEDDAKFCSSCGADQKADNAASEAAQKVAEAMGDVARKFNEFNNTPDTSNRFDSQDILDNKVMAALAYLGVLVLIPLLSRKSSPYARFHTNQGLILFLCGFVLNAVCTVLGGSLLQGLVSLVRLVFIVIGVQNALNGRAKELPIIGNYTILK